MKNEYNWFAAEHKMNGRKFLTKNFEVDPLKKTVKPRNQNTTGRQLYTELIDLFDEYLTLFYDIPVTITTTQVKVEMTNGWKLKEKLNDMTFEVKERKKEKN